MIRFIKELKSLFEKKPKWRIMVEQQQEGDNLILMYQVQLLYKNSGHYFDTACFDDYDKALQFVYDYNSFPHYFDELDSK
jgi:hypothetical protein